MRRIWRGNLHSHSTFSDGQNSLEEMVLAAIRKGFAYLGFSEHVWAECNKSFCVSEANIPVYLEEARRLKEAYAGQIELYVGLENEYYSFYPQEKLDFTIGSVHDLIVEATGKHYPVDHTPDRFRVAVEQAAGGDMRAFAAKYYDLLASLAESRRPDIVGHLDLITKFNEGGVFFDERSDWYRAIVEKACERIAATGCVVELNTGAIARGYRTEPYPASWILGLFRELQVPVTISSDAHSADGLDFWFDEAEALLRGCGFQTMRQLSGGKWIDIEL